MHKCSSCGVVGNFEFVAGASSSKADNEGAHLMEIYNIIAVMQAERREDRREVKDLIAAVMPMFSNFTETAAQLGLGLTDLKMRTELLENTLDGRYIDQAKAAEGAKGAEREGRFRSNVYGPGGESPPNEPIEEVSSLPPDSD